MSKIKKLLIAMLFKKAFLCDYLKNKEIVNFVWIFQAKPINLQMLRIIGTFSQRKEILVENLTHCQLLAAYFRET